MNAANPTRQMTLVGEAGVRCNFSQASSAFANKLDRALQSQMHDVTMRSDPNRASKQARRNLDIKTCKHEGRFCGHFSRVVVSDFRSLRGDIVFEAFRAPISCGKNPVPGAGLEDERTGRPPCEKKGSPKTSVSGSFGDILFNMLLVPPNGAATFAVTLRADMKIE